jgi:exodeoxyribonuclease VII small subunit
MTNKKNEQSLEQLIGSLEKIVADLEDGELSLELSLNKFEEGVKLTKQCQKIIHEAEQKIQIISGENIEKFEVKED